MPASAGTCMTHAWETRQQAGARDGSGRGDGGQGGWELFTNRLLGHVNIFLQINKTLNK